MADKAISELIAASEITGSDLFVLEQSGTAKKLSGQTLTTFLLQLIDGHGGITGIAKTGTSGLVDTYTITMADQSTTSFTVTNGARGAKGDNTYVWIKYSSVMPTKNSDMYDTPDNYMGIYYGSASTAPTTYTSYNWFQIKGAKGDTGSPATLTSQSVQYQASANGTVIPSGTWLDTIPTVAQGQYLWTRSALKFNTGDTQYAYSVSHFGKDGTGAIVTVNDKSPDAGGNVDLTTEDIGVYPAGAVYKSTDPTSPAALFGGTWEQLSSNADEIISTTTAQTTSDQGIVINWTIRKWLSGYVDMVGNSDSEASLTLTTYGSSNNKYANVSLAFPDNLFVETPSVVINARVGTGLYYLSPAAISKTSVAAYLVSTSNDTASARFTAHVSGKWTTSGQTMYCWRRTA